MKVLAVTSALLVACSSAAAIAGPAETYKTEDALKEREADAAPEPVPGFRWSPHGHGGWKRDAAPEPVPGFRWSPHGHGGWKRDAAPEPVPGWRYRWSPHGHGGWKRDAAPEPVPRWRFRWSPHGHGGWKRDAANAAKPEDDSDFIYLPEGMTPDDLAVMAKDAHSDSAPDAANTEDTKA